MIGVISEFGNTPGLPARVFIVEMMSRKNSFAISTVKNSKET
jgi:hypothetical protein